MRPAPRVPRRRQTTATLCLTLAACGGPGDAADAPRTPREAAIQAACQEGEERTLKMAAAEYVKRATPKPQRFLSAVGTDSALPDAGVRALQDMGPLYYFPGDSAQQVQVRAQLHEKGDYTTLLVVPRGIDVGDRAATIRLGGHYVGGAEDGRASANQNYRFACDLGGWRLINEAPERQA